MASQKTIRSALYGRWIIAIYAGFALVTVAGATPNSGIVISDQIIGTTPETFFVIRTTTLRPPTYYAYSKRVELVELSLASGKIEQQCLVRETAYEYDFEATKETWNQLELPASKCQPFSVLSQRGAAYIEPESMGPEYYEYQLSAEGLAARLADSDDPHPWQLIVTLQEMKAWAANVSKLSRSILTWQTDDDIGETFSVMNLGSENETLPDMCELHGSAVSSLRLERLFVKVNCWPGDDDADGAIFYLSIKAPPVGG